MKTLLALPPQFDPTSPNLALPSLTSFLRSSGQNIIQKDINVEFHDTMLSSNELEHIFELIKEREKSLRFLGVSSNSIDSVMKQKDFLVNNVEKAKAAFKNPDCFYDYQEYTYNLKILEDAFKFISSAYFKLELSFNTLKTIYSINSTQQLLTSVHDEFCNPYIDYYKRHTLPYVIRENPAVVGISISSANQVVPGLTLAYLVKQYSDKIYVVLGGNYFSFFGEDLKRNKSLFNIIDSIILYEGETALLELLNSLERGASLDKVPNLIYKNGKNICANKLFHVEEINNLPTPTFDGFPLNLYLTPRLTLPVYLSRGCYWNRCAFCNRSISVSNHFRTRDIKKVREDIEKLKEYYGCEVFGFVDSAISPKYMEELSDEFLNPPVDIEWLGFARFEKELDDRLCKKLFDSGCRALLFGLESVSNRVLDFMDKGTSIEDIQKVLFSCHRSGIANSVSFFFGFPTETLEEAKQTIQFVLEQFDMFSSLQFGGFMLLRHSKVFNTPSRYNVSKIYTSEESDLALEYVYDVDKGQTQEEIARIAKLFSKIKDALFIDSLDIFRLELPFVLYIMHYRTNDLSSFVFPAQEKASCIGNIRKERVKNAKELAASLLQDDRFVKLA